MSENNIDRAKTFCTAFKEKSIEAMAKCLHPDLEFIAPLQKLQGKEAYVEAAKEFASFFKTLTIRAILGEKDQAVVVYDVEYPTPIEKIPTVALMTFHENLITRIELFYDARPFEK
jgi:hypothetical protein